MKRSSATCRLRKVSCPECGYTVRMARSWMNVGLPACPCGSSMRPDAPADLAFVGLIGPEDMSQAAWNAICRENGWDIMLNQGQAARARKTRTKLVQVKSAAHCTYPGCGRWIAEGAERCTAGHAQHELAPAMEAMPF